MDRKGSFHTKVEIILALAENEDGIRKREDFLRSNFRGGYEVVDKSRFLSEKLIMEGSDGIGIMEKSLSELARDGYIERTSIGEGIFFKKAYKLRVQDMYDLVRIFMFILESEKAKGNNIEEYHRLQRFIESPFFRRAWNDHLLDIIYDLGLWNELDYPLKIEKDDIERIKEYKPLENMNRTSMFFRKYFPDRGPSKYEKFLKRSGYPEFLLNQLNDEIKFHIILFTFLDKEYGEVERNKEYSDYLDMLNNPLNYALDTWFNNFWYGNLENEREWFSHANPKGKLCILGIGRLLMGSHSFPNIETWTQHDSILFRILFPFERWIADEFNEEILNDINHKKA